MKKFTTVAILITIFGFVSLVSCNHNGTTSKIKESDTVKIAAWNKFIGGDSIAYHKVTTARDQPVPHIDADACIKRYQEVYHGAHLDTALIRKAYTESMTFGSYGLNSWLSSLNPPNTNTTQIRISLGLYTGNILQLGVKKDKLTVFLYPVDAAGQPAVYSAGATSASGRSATVGAQVDPFNLAGLKP